jgi:hypothetical protein
MTALGLHGGHGRQDDARHDFRLARLGHDRGGRVSAHAAGVGPAVAVADLLVVLRGDQRQGGLAVDQGEEAGLLALQVLLDDQLGAGRSEGLVEQRGVDRGLGLGQGPGHGHPFAGGEAVGLDHDGDAPVADIGLGRGGFGEAGVGGGRDVVAGAEVLHEALGAFERRRRGARPEGLDAGLGQAVGQAQDQGRLGADHHVVDALLPGEGDQAVDVLGADRHALGLPRDAGVARRAVELVAQRRGRDGPAERVFAPAAADHQNPHLLAPFRLASPRPVL